jgi:hypothetical protein
VPDTRASRGMIDKFSISFKSTMIRRHPNHPVRPRFMTRPPTQRELAFDVNNIVLEVLAGEGRTLSFDDRLRLSARARNIRSVPPLVPLQIRDRGRWSCRRRR